MGNKFWHIVFSLTNVCLPNSHSAKVLWTSICNFSTALKFRRNLLVYGRHTRIYQQSLN